MKSAKSIVQHIFDNPSYDKLHKFEITKKLMPHLPPRLQKAIKFIYIKETTLNIVILHNGYKMEIDYKKDFIKKLLNDIEIMEGFTPTKIQKVTVFATRAPLVPKVDTFLSYKEMAHGEFENLASDRALKKMLEAVRVKIHELRG